LGWIIKKNSGQDPQPDYGLQSIVRAKSWKGNYYVLVGVDAKEEKDLEAIWTCDCDCS